MSRDPTPTPDPETVPVDAPAGTGLLRPLLWVTVIAFAVRLPHLLETVQSVFFGVPILDEAFYELVARRLADGATIADVNPGFRPLLYPALLAFCRLLSADHWLFLAVAGQHALGVATCLLTALFAGRLFRRRAAALLAGGLYALAGPPLFYEGRLLITTLFTFLVAALLVVLGACRPADGQPSRILPWAAAGLLVAVAVQARANALVFLAALPFVALLGTRAATSAGPNRGLGRGFRRRSAWLPILAAAASTAAGLTLIAILQSPWSGDFRPLPGGGGVNLYLGNERGADGMVPRQDQHAVYGDVYRDSVQLFAAEEYRRATGRDGSPTEVSRYWVVRTLDEFLADPVGRLALQLRKTWLVAWPPEVPNNLAYAFVVEHESKLLGLLPVRWGWLLPLAVAGAWVAFRRRGGGVGDGGGVGESQDGVDGVRLAWLLALGVLHALSVIAFFVAGRFRIPLWPLAAILAAGALVALLDALRRTGSLRTDRRDGLVAVGLALGVFALGHVNWPGVELPGQARDFFYRSVAHYQAGDLEGALDDAHTAVELEPANPQALFQLGTVALAREDWKLAEAALFDASRLLHVEPRPFNNLGIALEQQGQHLAAYQAYLRAIEVGPDFSPAWVNAALLELRAGRVERAADRVAHAEALERAADRRTVFTLAARAFVERDLGHDDAARRAWAEAEALDRDVARELLRDNARRLRLAPPGPKPTVPPG